MESAGLSLKDAVGFAVEGSRLLAGSAGLLEAIRYFVDHRPRKSPDITVRQVVDELLALKKKEASIGPLHMRDLRNRLGRFAAAFACPISRVQPAEIRDYVLSQPVSERTQHNLRTTIATLFNFAKAEGYLPADFKGVPRPSKRRRVKHAIAVFTVEEMARLLSAATGEQLVALAIGGFAGIRAEELKRLQWEHLNFDEGHIVVPDAVAKCEERRLVPMADNLRAWLLPHRRTSGPVCPFANLAIVFERMAKRAGIAWKRNALRHSFISNRLALIKNVAQIAFEGGNSPAIVQRHYLKVVSEANAQRWFSLAPSQFSPNSVLPIDERNRGTGKCLHFEDRIGSANGRNNSDDRNVDASTQASL